MGRGDTPFLKFLFIRELLTCTLKQVEHPKIVLALKEAGRKALRLGNKLGNVNGFNPNSDVCRYRHRFPTFRDAPL